MFKFLLTILFIIVVIFGVYNYYIRNDEGEFLTFQVKTYDVNVLSSDYKEFSGKILGIYLCSRNDEVEGEFKKLLKRERYVFVKKIDSRTYEGKIYLTYLKDPNKEYYITCPAAYNLQYIDPMTETLVDFSKRDEPLTIYWAYPPPLEITD